MTTPNFDLNTPTGLETFLKAYHQELSNARDFPPLKIQKALHSAAAVHGLRNGEALLAALGGDLEASEDEPTSKVTITTADSGKGRGQIEINSIPICNEIFDEPLSNYYFINREDRIEELFPWIADQMQSDGVNAELNIRLMREELEFLHSIEDDEVLGNINDAEIIAQSDDPKSFDEKCLEILEISYNYTSTGSKNKGYKLVESKDEINTYDPDGEFLSSYSTDQNAEAWFDCFVDMQENAEE